MGHGGAEECDRSKIPDYRVFRVEDAPELELVQEALREKGLKDPWLRNEVWRFTPPDWTGRLKGLGTFFFRGFPLACGAFLATIALEGAAKMMGSGGGDEGGGGSGHGTGEGGRGHNIAGEGIATYYDDDQEQGYRI